MTLSTRAAICAFGVICTTHVLDAQSFSTYRQFELGSSLSTVAAAAGIAATEAKMVHQRPAVMQELEFRPSRWAAGLNGPSNDPVERIVFSFYNDQLFRIAIDYGTQRTEGMTSADLVEAISVVYGAPLAARSGVHAASPFDAEAGSPVARWGDGANDTVVLYQTSAYRGTFRLIVTDHVRADLAAKADADARRLDDREAPQRELARENKARADERDAAAKARLANKGGFHP